MRSRSNLWLGLLLLITIATWIVSRPRPSSPREAVRDQITISPPARPQSDAHPDSPASALPERSMRSTNPRGDTQGASGPPATAAAPETTAPAGRPQRPDTELIAALDDVRLMIRDYRAALGENPVGTNAEIMQAINGHNTKQVKIGPPVGQNMNEKGELVDRWGTPYFFHQISGTEMEIHSAGPDRVMGTPDDRQVK